MKAIVCKYLPATNTKPARVKAMAEGGFSVTVSCHSVPDDPERHAAEALVRKLDWNPVWLIRGGLPDQSNVFATVSGMAGRITGGDTHDIFLVR